VQDSRSDGIVGVSEKNYLCMLRILYNLKKYSVLCQL